MAASTAPQPRGSLGTPRGWQDPARCARMLLRHAALSAPSLPAGRRADGLTWMGRSSGRAARQLRLHRLSRPCRAQTRLPPSRCRRGPRSPTCRATAAAGAKAGSPSATRPHTALGRALPNAHELPGLPPGTAESKPSSGGKRPRGARRTTAPLAPLHGQAVQKGAGTGSEQQLDHDGYGRAAKSTRVKESGTTSTGIQDIQPVSTKNSLANRGE